MLTVEQAYYVDQGCNKCADIPFNLHVSSFSKRWYLHSLTLIISPQQYLYVKIAILVQYQTQKVTQGNICRAISLAREPFCNIYKKNTILHLAFFGVEDVGGWY